MNVKEKVGQAGIGKKRVYPQNLKTLALTGGALLLMSSTWEGEAGIKNSTSFLVTEHVRGQPGLHKTPSQTTKTKPLHPRVVNARPVPSIPLTGLESRLEHIWGDCHDPVEDPCKAASHQNPRHTEVTDTAEHHNPVRQKPGSRIQTSSSILLREGVTGEEAHGLRPGSCHSGGGGPMHYSKSSSTK